MGVVVGVDAEGNPVQFFADTHPAGSGVGIGKTATGAAGAATLNKASGVVTTESVTTAAGADYSHTVSNSGVAAGDMVLVSVTTSGTGTPVVTKVTPANGSFTVGVHNVHASAAFSAALKLAFNIVKA